MGCSHSIAYNGKAVGAVRNLKTNYMKTAKEIKEELEKEHGWNFSSEENMEMYYDLFLDVQKVVLRQPPVVVRSEQLVCSCDKWHDRMEESNNNCSTCDKPIN